MERTHAQLQIVLPAEYEDMIISRFGQLADIAIEKKIEQASFQKKYIKQTELMAYLGCGMKVIEELYTNGLKWIPLGKSKLIDLEDLDEVLGRLKK